MAFIERTKKEEVINKPIHVGFFILEFSKLIMQEFFYDVMQPAFGIDNVHLLLTDTDSFIFQIYGHDIPAQIKNDKTNLHHLVKKWIDMNDSKTPGLFKDECGLLMMTEFVALRSKMYSFKTSNNNSKNTAKGVSKMAKKSLKFDDYKRILDEGEKMVNTMHSLRSFGHEINLIEMEKVSLCAFDDKSLTINGSYETLPIGYKA